VGNSLILDKFIRSLQIHFDQTNTTIRDFVIIGGAAIKFTVNGDRITDVGSTSIWTAWQYEQTQLRTHDRILISTMHPRVLSPNFSKFSKKSN